MKSIYTQTINENYDDESGALGDKEELLSWDVTNTQYFVDLNPALKAIDQKLQEYKSKFKGATLAAL